MPRIATSRIAAAVLAVLALSVSPEARGQQSPPEPPASSPPPAAARARPPLVPGGHREPNAQARVEIDRTRRAMAAGRIAEALEANRKAVELDSLSSVVFETLGVTCQVAGLPREAYDAYRRAAMLDPSSASAFNRAGQVLLSQLGRPAGAAVAFRQALAVAPGYAPAHYSLSIYHLLRGEIEEAESEADQAFDSAADESEQALFFGARIQLSLVRGHYREADDALRAHLAEVPADRRSRQARALALRLLGRHAEAETVLGDLLAQVRPTAALASEMGLVQLALARIDSAETWFRQAWDLDATAGEAGYQLALARLAAGDTSGALGWLARVEERDRGWYATALLAGRIYAARGDAERAARAFARARSLNPVSCLVPDAADEPRIGGRRGSAAHDSLLEHAERALLDGDLGAALQLAYHACLEGGSRPPALLLASWAGRPSGGAQGGRAAHLEAALEALPATERVQRAVAERELGLLHLRLGNRADGRTHLQRALEALPPQDPVSAAAAAGLLALHLEAGELPAARKLAGRISDPGDPDLLAALARVAEAAGDAARAQGLRERARAAGFLPS